MTLWPALLLAPLLVLLQQSLMYSLVTPACGHQTTVLLHGTAALSLLLVLGLTALAAGTWLKTPRQPAASQRRFLAAVATVVGSLSALVALAMWMPVWALSPCLQ